MRIEKLAKACDCGCGRIVHRYPSQVKGGFYFEKACFDKMQSGEKNGKRRCSQCRLMKPLSEFLRKPSGITRSYCKKCMARISNQRQRGVHERFMRARRRAIARQGDSWWTLSEVEYAELVNQCCRYCGGCLNATGSGLDRQDNSIGYTAENSVPCCKRCNVIKNDYFTYEEMMQLAPLLRQIRRQRQKARKGGLRAVEE